MRRKVKQILKIITDLFMTALLLLLMAYSLIGEAAHEWLGIAIFGLFILHHVLNLKWCRNLFRGKYPLIRILQTALALSVFLCMAGSMISGILLSRYVFRLDIHSFSAVLRTVHMLSAYWGFVFLSLHLGLHWRGMMGMAGKLTKKPLEFRKWALRGIAALIAGYGAYAFIKRDFGNYMLLRYHFVFFNFEESRALFLLDYAAIMGLFVCVGYYLAALLQKSRTRR